MSFPEHGLLLDLAQHGEQGRLHAVAVESVLSGLKEDGKSVRVGSWEGIRSN